MGCCSSAPPKAPPKRRHPAKTVQWQHLNGADNEPALETAPKRFGARRVSLAGASSSQSLPGAEGARDHGVVCHDPIPPRDERKTSRTASSQQEDADVGFPFVRVTSRHTGDEPSPKPEIGRLNLEGAKRVESSSYLPDPDDSSTLYSDTHLFPPFERSLTRPLSARASPRRSSVQYTVSGGPLVQYTALSRDHYDIERDIGSGTFGSVFLVRHTPTDTRYAVKQIKEGSLMRLGADKLIKEVTMMTSIAHPNVVTLHALEFDPNSFSVWLLMEYVDGARNLGEIRAEHGEGVGEDRARRFLIQILEGLQAIHLAGIAHRDIKCENFVVDSSERLKITDFGLSCLQPIGEDGQAAKEHYLKNRCGTPNYAAPEMLSPEAGYDGFKADVWSVGVVLYGMLVGKLPFPGGSLATLFVAIQGEDYVIPESVGVGAADLIRRVLKVDVAKRATITEIFDHPWVTADPQLFEEYEAIARVRAPTDSDKADGSIDLANSISDFFQRHGRTDRALIRSVSRKDGEWLREREDPNASSSSSHLSLLATKSSRGAWRRRLKAGV